MLSRRDTPISKKGYSGEFRERCALFPKRPLPGISRGDMLPLQKGIFKEFQEEMYTLFKKSYSIHEIQEGICSLSKRIIPRNSRRDILQKGLFQRIQEGMCSPKQKDLFQGIQEGISALFKKSYSREFKNVYFPSLKKTLPRNSRRDILPLQKGYYKN